MSRFDNEIRVTPSVLDRLLDYEPEVTREPPASRPKSLRLLKAALRRDLEWLLNTREVNRYLPAELAEVQKSVAAFGLPDFSNASARNPSDLIGLRKQLESAIARFEPRLEDVTVSLEPVSETDRAIKFHIDAQLRVDPAPEPITFDSVLQLGKGEFTLKET